MDACKKINAMLDRLARTMFWCKVLRLHCFKANPNFDPIALPVIMVYKGGELVQNFVKVTDDLPKDFKMEDLQWLLENAGVVNPSSVEGSSTDGSAPQDRDASSSYTGVNTNGVTITHTQERAVPNIAEEEDQELENYMEGFVGNLRVI